MKSLCSELETIVREESRKAETKFSEWGVADHERLREAWTKIGGETITMAPADAKAYQTEVDAVVASVSAAQPKSKDDYDAFVAAAKKYR